MKLNYNTMIFCSNSMNNSSLNTNGRVLKSSIEDTNFIYYYYKKKKNYS